MFGRRSIRLALSTVRFGHRSVQFAQRSVQLVRSSACSDCSSGPFIQSFDRFVDRFNGIERSVDSDQVILNLVKERLNLISL